MAEFRRVTDDFWVSPQISVQEVAQAKALGFVAIVNNRPDGEAPGQPASREIEAAARALGMNYLHAPVSGPPTPEAIVAVDAVASGRKTLAFCRSGTRSIVTWTLGQTRKRPRDEIVRLAGEAGYDVSTVV
ncbi:MAG TPA: TIGR01244 family sulfur transferase [Caulobacteraceae bacterium]|nr:TIGR01244 family sulfur transferase [Caulobacteraceae bacterium]